MRKLLLATICIVIMLNNQASSQSRGRRLRGPSIPSLSTEIRNRAEMNMLEKIAAFDQEIQGHSHATSGSDSPAAGHDGHHSASGSASHIPAAASPVVTSHDHHGEVGTMNAGSGLVNPPDAVITDIHGNLPPNPLDVHVDLPGEHGNELDFAVVHIGSDPIADSPPNPNVTPIGGVVENAVPLDAGHGVGMGGHHGVETAAGHIVDTIAHRGVDAATGHIVDTTAHHGVDAAVGHGVDTAAHHGVDAAAGHIVDTIAHHGVDAAVGHIVDTTAHHGVDAAAGHIVDTTAHHGVDAAAGHDVDTTLTDHGIFHGSNVHQVPNIIQSTSVEPVDLVTAVEAGIHLNIGTPIDAGIPLGVGRKIDVGIPVEVGRPMDVGMPVDAVTLVGVGSSIPAIDGSNHGQAGTSVVSVHVDLPGQHDNPADGEPVVHVEHVPAPPTGIRSIELPGQPSHSVHVDLPGQHGVPLDGVPVVHREVVDPAASVIPGGPNVPVSDHTGDGFVGGLFTPQGTAASPASGGFITSTGGTGIDNPTFAATPIQGGFITDGTGGIDIGNPTFAATPALGGFMPGGTRGTEEVVNEAITTNPAIGDFVNGFGGTEVGNPTMVAEGGFITSTDDSGGFAGIDAPPAIATGGFFSGTDNTVGGFISGPASPETSSFGFGSGNNADVNGGFFNEAPTPAAPVSSVPDLSSLEGPSRQPDQPSGPMFNQRGIMDNLNMNMLNLGRQPQQPQGGGFAMGGDPRRPTPNIQPMFGQDPLNRQFNPMTGFGQGQFPPMGGPGRTGNGQLQNQNTQSMFGQGPMTQPFNPMTGLGQGQVPPVGGFGMTAGTPQLNPNMPSMTGAFNPMTGFGGSSTRGDVGIASDPRRPNPLLPPMFGQDPMTQRPNPMTGFGPMGTDQPLTRGMSMNQGGNRAVPGLGGVLPRIPTAGSGSLLGDVRTTNRNMMLGGRGTSPLSGFTAANTRPMFDGRETSPLSGFTAANTRPMFGGVANGNPRMFPPMTQPGALPRAGATGTPQRGGLEGVLPSTSGTGVRTIGQPTLTFARGLSRDFITSSVRARLGSLARTMRF